MLNINSFQSRIISANRRSRELEKADSYSDLGMDLNGNLSVEVINKIRSASTKIGKCILSMCKKEKFRYDPNNFLSDHYWDGGENKRDLDLCKCLFTQNKEKDF